MELYSRTMSAIPVSIGTSLALESIFLGSQAPYDPKREIPNRIDLTEYQQCYINIETLLRNISSSVDSVTFMECLPLHVLEILNTEIEIITSLFEIEGRKVCQPVFYYCTYKSVRAHTKSRVIFRESMTVKQKTYDHKAEQVIAKLEKSTDSIFKFDSEIKPRVFNKALIMTHTPYDLTSYSKFRELHLLESHTGLLKKRTQWNTKYSPLGEFSLTHLPFFKDLLFIFGDKNQIGPQSWKLRKSVYDISIKDKWTPFTTLEKIKQSYKNSSLHPADVQLLTSF